MIPAVGDAIPPFVHTVRAEDMRVWAPILRDANPIHLDPEVVRVKGLGDRVVNQGPANLAYVMNALAGAFPGGRISSVDVRLLDNVLAGDVVETAGTITAVEPADSGGLRIAVDIRLDVRGRGPALGGSATVVLPA